MTTALAAVSKNILRLINLDFITVLPDIHREHTEKKKYDNIKSLGPVPQDRLNMIRVKAGLPVVKTMYALMCDDDLYY